MLAGKLQGTIAALQRIGITKAKIGIAGFSISWRVPQKRTRPTIEIYRESKTVIKVKSRVIYETEERATM